MDQPIIYLIADAGNTQIKLVYFQGGSIKKEFRIDATDLKTVQKVIVDHNYHRSILSSVQSDQSTAALAAIIQPDVVLNHQTQLPIDISAYKTPETLGSDRVANMVAADHLSKGSNALVIDIGTCIKYDLILQGKYQGGAIAPGLQMRFKALHDYTGKLPLLEVEEKANLIGTSTALSIQSGVLNGMLAEMNEIIAQYNQQIQPLTIFLTGGDAKRFDKALKNSIFAEENLTVKGLHLILQHNG